MILRSDFVASVATPAPPPQSPQTSCLWIFVIVVVTEAIVGRRFMAGGRGGGDGVDEDGH